MASSRILLSAWLLFTVTLAAAYSGNLIASMTDGRQKVPFSTLEELAQQDTYQWGLLGGTSFVTLFKVRSITDIITQWKLLDSPLSMICHHLC